MARPSLELRAGDCAVQVLTELDQGVREARRVELALDAHGGHWHAALGGGVLHRDQSRHDLDLVIYPHRVRRGIGARPQLPSVRSVHAAMRALGYVLVANAARVRRGWRKKGSDDEKRVEVWRHAVVGRRVDLIYGGLF